jgi:hypothetical protein
MVVAARKAEPDAGERGKWAVLQAKLGQAGKFLNVTPPGKVSNQPSRVTQAVAYMRAELKTLGDKPGSTWRNELFERTAEKFGLKVGTVNAQWHRHIVKSSTGRSRAAAQHAP